jgi:hypothetical protein
LQAAGDQKARQATTQHPGGLKNKKRH